MTKDRSHHTRRKRQLAAQMQASLDGADDRVRAIYDQWGILSPEEQAEEQRLIALENAKLVEMFGQKDDYSDDEVDAMHAILKAEGVLPRDQ